MSTRCDWTIEFNSISDKALYVAAAQEIEDERVRTDVLADWADPDDPLILGSGNAFLRASHAWNVEEFIKTLDLERIHLGALIRIEGEADLHFGDVSLATEWIAPPLPPLENEDE